MTARFKKLFDEIPRLLKIGRGIEDLKINQGRILSDLNRDKTSSVLADYEFKVFSQWGEDGILQFLTANLAIPNRTFIEFGVEDFYESNCRFLMMKDLWEGFVIDGSPSHIAALKSADFYWKYPLTAQASFITRENVATLLQQSGFEKDLGILSIDIDGVDYYVLDALAEWRPRILVVEYNGIFGMSRPVSVPYSANFQRNAQHPSNLYYGASLAAFYHLTSLRGYALVGVNSAGSNAFFVRRELLNDRVRESSLTGCYRSSCFREGRGEDGRLMFLSGADRRTPIAHLPLIDVVSGETLTVGDLGCTN